MEPRKEIYPIVLSRRISCLFDYMKASFLTRELCVCTKASHGGEEAKCTLLVAQSAVIQMR